MIRNFKRTAALVGVVAAGSAALVACSDSSDSADTTTAADATTAETSAAEDSTDSESSDASGSALSGQEGTLVGEGASSQQNAMEYFRIEYGNAVPGAELAYNPTGSGSGVSNFIAGQVDFAGSDSPLDEEDGEVEEAAARCEGNEAWHLPMVIGPVSIAYNLDGVDELALDIPTVAQIFSGEITNWNDPAIAESNPDVELPDQNIQVVYRSDESGTSDNFQKFLSIATPENWEGSGKAFPQTVGEGANGSNGVASQAAATPGAITYVEAGFVTQNQALNSAQLDFGSGPVELNNESVGVALDNLQFETEGHNMVVDAEALFAQTEAGAYPLILTVYEIVCSAGYDEETSNLVKDFLTVVLDSQDEGLEQQGFIPVSGAHAERLREAVAAIQ